MPPPSYSSYTSTLSSSHADAITTASVFYFFSRIPPALSPADHLCHFSFSVSALVGPLPHIVSLHFSPYTHSPSKSSEAGELNYQNVTRRDAKALQEKAAKKAAAGGNDAGNGHPDGGNGESMEEVFAHFRSYCARKRGCQDTSRKGSKKTVAGVDRQRVKLKDCGVFWPTESQPGKLFLGDKLCVRNSQEK